MTSALLYKLEGTDDHLLQITVDQDQEGGNVDPPQILLILDASGSMGASVSLAEQAVGLAAQEMGYKPDHKIEVIYFSDHAFRAQPTISQLIVSRRQCMGMTSMSEVPHAIKDILNADPTQGFQIIMISDGEVHDKGEVNRLMTQLARELGGRPGPVSVALIRLKTSQSGSPDTMALSCIGALNTQGNVPVNDIVAWKGHQENDTVKALVMTTLTGHFGQAGRQTWEVKGNTPSFRRLPTDKYRKCLYIPAGTTFLLIKAEDLDQLVLELGDQMVEIIEVEGGLQSEDQISELLGFLEQQIRLWTVMGTQKEMIQQTISWLRKLSNRLMVDTMNASGQTVDDSLKGRAARLRKVIHKREKSMINRILQLENVDNMSKFNSQQQADFLRQASDNKRGKGLMRRAKGKDEDFDYDELARQALKDLATVDVSAEIAQQAEEQGMTSFFSQVNQVDVICDAKSILNDLESVLELGTADDLLQILGSIGLAYQGPISDFPDPWRYFVNKVFPGCQLAQADLWMAHVQGSGAKLTPPGQQNEMITGVDALASPCPEVFMLFARKARAILEIQASLSMRRTKARVPQDDIALKTAVTVCLIKQMCNLTDGQGLTTVAVQALIWELRDLRMLVQKRYQDTFDPMAKNLLEQEPGAYLTGDLNISSANQLVCVLLAHSSIDDLVNDEDPLMQEQLAKVLRAIYSLEIYHSVRGSLRVHGENWQTECEKLLHQILGIDLVNDGIKLEDEVADDAYPSAYDLTAVKKEIKTKSLLPKGHSPKSLSHVILTRRATLGLGNLAVGALQAKLMDLLEISDQVGSAGLKQMFGLNMSIDDWTVIQVVLALLYPDMHQRVDTQRRTMKLPDLRSDEDLVSFLQSTISKIYREDHHRRVSLQAKTLAENLAMRRAVERSLPQFSAELGSHTHGGKSRKIFWDTLEGALRSGSIEKVQAFLDKSNDPLANGHRFRRMVKDYGNAEMKLKWGSGGGSKNP